MDETINFITLYLINPLVIGLLLDSLLGDPLWLPHPIRLFGKLIHFGDKTLNRGRYKVLKGSLCTILLFLLVVVTLTLALYWLAPYPILSLALEAVLIFFGVANRSLITEAYKIERTLKTEGVQAARTKLQMIVGRDTSKLSAKQIRIATLETLSENLSDGVIAPLFFYAIGGVPLMLGYKMVNTLDSMIGYKNENYLQFGRFAAKFDDVLNYIPARITALLIAISCFSWRSIQFIITYGNKHASPNAGYPEAALAGILNCRFGGPNYYKGVLVHKPYIGKIDKELSHSDILKACTVNAMVTLIFLIVILLLNCPLIVIY